MKKFRKSKKGFTLIELVVVIAILAILAVIALPRLAGLQENANNKAIVANLKMIDNAVSVYAADNNVTTASVTKANLNVATGLIPNWPTGPKATVYSVVAGVATATVTANDVPGVDGGTYTLVNGVLTAG